MGVLSSSDCQSEPSLQLLCYLIIPLEGLEVMVIIYSILVTRVWYHSNLAISKLACENIRFSSLFAAGERRNGKNSQVFYLGSQGLKDGYTNKTFGEPFGIPDIFPGVPGPPSWWPKLINQ